MRNQNIYLFGFEQKEKNLDKRIKKTKRKVIDTLISNFDRDGFFDGNITTLCRDSGINRTTFYENFKDIDGLESYAQCIESLEIVNRIEDMIPDIKDISSKFFLVIDKLIDILEEKKERLFKAYKVDIKQSVFSMLNFLIASLIMEIFPLKDDSLESNAKIRMLCGGLNYYLYYEYRNEKHSSPDVIKKLCYVMAKPFFDCFEGFGG